MQRYKPIMDYFMATKNEAPWPARAILVQHENGEWVKFSDAQAKSLADERRIEELEQLVERAVECIQSCDHGCDDLPNSRHCSICQEASAIEAALRVGTKC